MKNSNQALSRTRLPPRVASGRMNLAGGERARKSFHCQVWKYSLNSASVVTLIGIRGWAAHWRRFKHILTHLAFAWRPSADKNSKPRNPRTGDPSSIQRMNTGLSSAKNVLFLPGESGADEKKAARHHTPSYLERLLMAFCVCLFSIFLTLRYFLPCDNCVCSVAAFGATCLLQCVWLDGALRRFGCFLTRPVPQLDMAQYAPCVRWREVSYSAVCLGSRRRYHQQGFERRAHKLLHWASPGTCRAHGVWKGDGRCW